MERRIGRKEGRWRKRKECGDDEIYAHMMAAGNGKGKDGKKVESPCKREDRCSAWGAKEERKEGERKERGESPPPPPPGMHMCVRVREKEEGEIPWGGGEDLSLLFTSFFFLLLLLFFYKKNPDKNFQKS